MSKCIFCCVPFSSSEFFSSLGVNSHGPVHTACKPFFQQEFCDVTILRQNQMSTVKKNPKRNKTKSQEVTMSPLGTDSGVLPGEGLCPVWSGWGSSPGWFERLAEEDGIQWRIWPLLRMALAFLYHLLPSWMWDTERKRNGKRNIDYPCTNQCMFSKYLCIKMYNWLNTLCKKLFSLCLQSS